MSWVVIVWSMTAASSLTLTHLFVWFRQRRDYSHLLFFLLAASAGMFGWFELLLMQSTTPDVYAATLRWAHVPLCAFVLSDSSTSTSARAARCSRSLRARRA